MEFSQIGTSSVDATFFRQFQAALTGPCTPRKVPIYGTGAYSAPGLEAATVGNITLVLRGTLEIRCDCTWSFAGRTSSAPDIYDFNRSTQRTFWGEASTIIGSYLPGTPYQVNIVGQKPEQASGVLSGTPTCCR
jgi:hypothetical protein